MVTFEIVNFINRLSTTVYMSGEQIYNQEHNMTPKASGQPARVNINVLLTKVREEKKRRKIYLRKFGVKKVKR